MCTVVDELSDAPQLSRLAAIWRAALEGRPRRESDAPQLSRLAAILPAVLVAGGACRTDPAPASRATAPPLKRGDIVVVERAAAEFFEARVLSVGKESLNVQTSTEGDPIVVAASDAYRVGQGAHAFAKGAAAICRSGPSKWEACRVVTPGTDAVDVELSNGESRSLGAGELLPPGPVTVLDIERHFEVLAARKQFAATALAAGQPRRPNGWTPAPREPVLARKGTEWYPAHAAQLLSDGGESVVWESNGGTEPLPGGYVVPVPPFEHTFSRGDYALCRPATPGGAWERVNVETVGEGTVVIVGASGERRRVDAHSLVPLSRLP